MESDGDDDDDNDGNGDNDNDNDNDDDGDNDGGLVNTNLSKSGANGLRLGRSEQTRSRNVRCRLR